MRNVILIIMLSITAVLGMSSLAAVDGASARRVATVPVITQLPEGFEANSTQVVCALTGTHGAYTELPPHYTASTFGVNSGDSGSSFEFDGHVWWLFGNSGASTTSPWGKQNAQSRWPNLTSPLDSPAALDSDSIATSSVATAPPAPVAPYNDTEMPRNQKCPVLHFIRQAPPKYGPSMLTPFANPSLSSDPLFGAAGQAFPVSLRTGELPEAGISEGDPAQMYVVFGTDNTANCRALSGFSGPCPWQGTTPVTLSCGSAKAPPGSRTRSVMAVYTGAPLRFKGLYDLSVPATRYGPTCPTAPQDDVARFVNVQMVNGKDGYVYIWGTEGGANNDHSPVYLARMPAANIATGKGTAYWDDTVTPAGFVPGQENLATPLFSDGPAPCAAQLGVQYNQYLSEWIMLYHCREMTAPPGHPNGIYMRTAPNPWGPWSSPTTIFNPSPDRDTRSGYCYFIYSTQTQSTKDPDGSPICPKGSPNNTLADPQTLLGSYYGPYFVANWTTGTRATLDTRESTTIYYTLDTFDPYGQLILRSTILGPPVPAPTKPGKPSCHGTSCM